MQDIRHHFGQRVRELRLRSGMSQEVLAHRAGLDRTYITDVERGSRNISLVNIEKIAAALRVSIEYLFSSERFNANPAYQQKDLVGSIAEKFQYHLDSETRVLSFTVKGLLSPQDVDYMDRTLIGICNSFHQGEISLLVDHRFMLAADGEAAVYSEEVASKALAFQQKLLKKARRVAVLCNSEFMVQNITQLTLESGLHERSFQLFGKDRFMIQEAFEILGITGNELVKEKRA